MLNIRKEKELREYDYLHPKAQKSKESRGRKIVLLNVILERHMKGTEIESFTPKPLED